MSKNYGSYGPTTPWLGSIARWTTFHLARVGYALSGVSLPESRDAQTALTKIRERLALGETVYLAGIGTPAHDTGIALVEVSATNGIRLISNDQEERFSRVKHEDRFPKQAVGVFRQRLAQRGLSLDDISAFLFTWDSARVLRSGVGMMFDHFPFSLPMGSPKSSPKANLFHSLKTASVPQLLATEFAVKRRIPIIFQPHHDNHAAYSFAVSPFYASDTPVMITVLDGFGDTSAISLYVAQNGKIQQTYQNHSLGDSLGAFYSIISSTKGGWTSLSSEGRYMGAAAWGDSDRLTNPFYKSLREIFHFAPGGKLHVNQRLANWCRRGEAAPYTEALRKIIGDPIPHEKLWNPDAVLNVEDVNHSEITRERVDLAAATQLVFEDALFHIIDHFIRETGADKLVMAGGTALNCVANMHLMERYNRDWYGRNLKKDTRLHLWVPPVPSDVGVAPGSAFSFAMQAGARPGETLQHAFYCGLPPTTDEIRQALAANEDIDFRELANVKDADGQYVVADLAASILAKDGVIGLFQGSAETGPRALGHRSILANPCNPKTLENINRLVKFREPIRPLAPMATLEAALKYFELNEGASDDSYNAYNYMVLTARAKALTRKELPAIVHHDGTSRVQIVREEQDPFCHALLKAMGRHLGAEVSVNTSLNVGAPIAQSPQDAIDTMKRAAALTALLMIGDSGESFLVWHTQQTPPKDGGARLLNWYAEWQSQTGRTDNDTKMVAISGDHH
ncbi:MAG TPA: carbamoyltransferase C-terminal domain-containing protein [Planctomycetaceae bacterium]|nr:carbamoyltransferase C-terminal domain-containing protein [Planctomycetaceae bacterium]